MPSGGREQPATEGKGYGQETVDTVGTPELIVTAGEETRSILLIAHPGNSGNVYIGFDNDVSSSTGVPLSAGNGFSVDLDNSKQALWFDADNAADIIAWMATN